MESKAQLLEALEQARRDLWNQLNSVSDTAHITPGMTKREVFAHIAGWEALVFDAFREHVYGIPATRRAYHGVDALNDEFLVQRKHQTTESAKLESEINRFAINTILAAIPESDFGGVVRFPWGEESIPTFIQGAINHEREHEEEVIKYKQGTVGSAS